MATVIRLWEVQGQGLKPLQEASLAESHVEAELETWIARDAEILGDRLLIIDRQRDIPGVGRLDLLAVDQSGRLAVIELKRDRAPREAVAQALDYASWLDGTTEDVVEANAERYLGRPLAKAFFDYFQMEMPELSCQQHRIILVAPRLDASAERIIAYLSERYGVDINAVFFQCTKLDDGREILARTMLVAEEARIAGAIRKRRPGLNELLAMAEEKGTRALVDACRRCADVCTEQPEKSYGGSLRYWAKNGSGQWRMVFGVNIAAKNSPPAGQLDVWLPVRSLAEVSGESEDALRVQLREHPVLEFQTVDCWLRLKSARDAEGLVELVRGWCKENRG